MGVQKRWLRRLDFLVIGLAVLLLGALALKRHSTKGQSGATRPITLTPGANLPPLSAEFRRAQWTLVMAMAVGCPFCERSAPFYRQITSDHSLRSKVRFVAAFPQPPSDSRKYLDRYGIRVDGVIQANLPRLGIFSVPTLVLVGRNGTVSSIWFGDLDGGQQKQFVAALRNPEASQGTSVVGDGGSAEGRNSRAAPELVDREGLKRWRHEGIKFTLIDVRDRAAFSHGHQASAINIPLGELGVRGPIELSPSSRIVMDCTSVQYLMCYYKARELARLGFDRLSILTSQMPPCEQPDENTGSDDASLPKRLPACGKSATP